MTNINDNNVTDDNTDVREFISMLTEHMEQMRNQALKEMGKLCAGGSLRFMAVVETWQEVLETDPSMSETEAFALITGVLAERLGKRGHDDAVMMVLATTVMGAKLYVDATKGTNQGVTKA
jgi:hypothetical protein